MKQEISQSFRFDPLSASKGKVEIVTPSGVRQVLGGVNDKYLAHYGVVSPVVADLIDLATAIWIADRTAGTPNKRLNGIRLQLPIRLKDSFGSSGTTESLGNLLWQYTGEEWHLEFVSHDGYRRTSEIQESLFNLRDVSRGRPEVALWSGGLDALVGLASRVTSNAADHFILIGSGSNRGVLKSQRTLHDLLSLPKGVSSELVQVPLHVANTKGVGLNRWQRSRALTFQLIGSAVAIHLGIDKLHIYENGVGAINLPNRACEVGLDHARSVHPKSLILTQRFVSLISNNEFKIVNPFLFFTKAEMCKELTTLKWDAHVASSTSCDQARRSSKRQCGICSSCLLRRQALLAGGLSDKTEYFSENMDVKGSHLFAMRIQARRFSNLLGVTDPWRSMVCEFPALGELVDCSTDALNLNREDLILGLLDLYGRYAAEWQRTQFGNVAPI